MQSNTPEKYFYLVTFSGVLTNVWVSRGEWFGLNSSKPFTLTTPHMCQHPWKRHKMGIFFGGVWLFSLLKDVLSIVTPILNSFSKMLADTKQGDTGNFETLALLHELTNLKPFSAYRLFNISCSTLTSVLGTFITYFIILYQTVDCSK